MKYLLGLILLISVSASAQYSPTAAKTRFVNGIGLGTKDTATMNAADTVAMIVGRDSLVYFRYKGYWKPLAYNSSLTGYIPYTGATSAIDLNAKTVVNISHLGINTTTVPTILLRVVGDNNSTSRIAMRGYSSDANSSSIRVTKFRGTVAAPQAPLSGDNLGKFELAGYGTTSSEGYPQATFEGLATENWGATARGAKVQFKVTPNTTTTQAIALTINQDKSAVFESSVTAISANITANNDGKSIKMADDAYIGNLAAANAVVIRGQQDSLSGYLYFGYPNSAGDANIGYAGSGNILISKATTTSGSSTSTSFIKTGGTSSQFLKADGSVDASTYLTTSSAASTYLPLSGGTLTGALNGTSATFSGTLKLNGASGALSLDVLSSSTFDGIRTYNTNSAQGADIRIGNDANNNLGFLRVGGSAYGGIYQNSFVIGTGGGYDIKIAPNGTVALNFANGGVSTFTSSSSSYGQIKLIASSGPESSVSFRLTTDSDATSWVIGKGVGSTTTDFGIYYGATIARITTAGVWNFSSRLNVNGATDDGSTALNVTGNGKFSGNGIFSGNVGIGVATAFSKLHVSSGVSSNTQILLGPATASGNYSFINWNNNSGSEELKFYTDAGFISFYANTSEKMRIASTGATTITNLAGTGSRVVVADASGTLSATDAAPTSGTYTPTITLVTNAASSTARVCQYMRVGSVVTVSGYVTVTATTPAASSRIYMSLPISSSFTSTAQAGGAGGVPGGANIGTVIFANSTSTTVSMDFLPVSGATDYWFTYTYQIL